MYVRREPLARMIVGGSGNQAMQKMFGMGDPAPASGPSAADAAEEAKRKAKTDAENRKGSASSLLTSTDLGSTFGQISLRKTLLGGA